MKLRVDLKNYSKPTVRLNKYLADQGILSRRKIDRLIEEKKIHLNDRVATLGEQVKTGDSVFINEDLEDKKYFLYNKPRGETTTFKILNGIRYEHIGRLDKESEGLLMYTNDFSIMHPILNPENAYEREYLVQVKESVTPRVKTILERGIYTEEGTYAPAKRVTLEANKHTIDIILTEGKKHEIRRMLNALHLTILSLKRVRFLFLHLGKLKPGEFRELTDIEKTKLLQLLQK